jgi:RND family efflux transporter MFP subunit
MNGIKISILLFIGVICYGCTPSQAASDKQELAKKSYVEKQVVEVITQKVKQGTFAREMVSNGFLMAREKAVVPFNVDENILDVFVSEGEQVQKGQKLAKVDPFSFDKKRKEADVKHQKALIDLDDLLLGYGYSLEDTAKVPDHIMQMCNIRSDIKSSEAELEESTRELDRTNIMAPISGVVCNLEAKANNNSSEFEKCCEILDNRSMIVEFHILEGELDMVKKGQPVEVFPFALPATSKKGVIKSINPTVEEGLIKVCAEIPNTDGVLMDGMSVKILVKNGVPNCIVIPKSAVLYRQNRKVVFVHREGVAFWVYVEIGLENSTHVTIVDESLKPGDEVIVSNNLNLAHESPVKVSE